METHANNSSLSPGAMLNWYRIGRVLGRGGFGITYLAHDSNLHTDVAIKEYLPTAIAQRAGDNSVNPNTEDDESTFNWGLASFLEEARTLVRFKHPNIVRVLAVFEANGTAYMVMEFEHGQDLKKLLSLSEFPDEDFLKGLMNPIIDGLSEVHRHGFIHRDIKPANIYIRDDNTPVLIDFGSARLALSNATQHLTALVSVGYTPLEQYGDSSGQQQGPWSDIYALAAVLYFAIVGTVPPDSTLRASAVLNNKPDPLQPISVIGRNRYSTNFLAAIDWALGFKVSERPQTLDAWRTVLFADDRTVLRSPLAIIRSQPNSGAPNGTTDAILQHRRSPAAKRTSTQSEQTKVADPQRVHDQLFDETNWDIPRSIQQSTQQSAPKRSMRVKAPLWLLFVTVAVGIISYWQWLQTSDNELEVVPVRAEFESDTGQSQDSYSAESVTLALPKQGIAQKVETAGEAELAAQQARAAEASQAEIAALQSREAEVARKADLVAVQAREANAAREAELAAQQAREADAAREAELAAVQARAAEAAREAEFAVLQAREAESAREAEFAAQQAREAESTRQAELTAQQAREAKAAEQADFAAQQTREAEAARQAELAAQRAREVEAARRAELAARQTREAKAAKLARQQAREAEAARKAELATRQAREADAVREADVAVKPITDTEIQTAASRFNELMKTIRSRDLEQLRNLTSSSNQYEGLFQYWFANFESIDVKLSGISSNRSSERVNALLIVSQLVRSNGDIVLPAKLFQSIPIHTARRNGDWSKIQWSIPRI